MSHYILAIDETGSFGNGDGSFVGGVCLKDKNNEYISDFYGKLRSEYGKLVQTETEEETKTFHFTDVLHDAGIPCSIKESLKAVFKEMYDPIFDVAFVSSGIPNVYVNNQQWWFTAVIVVIEKFLTYYDFTPEDRLEILIDSRNAVTWGLLCDSFNKKKVGKEDLGCSLSFLVSKHLKDHIGYDIYHKNLLAQIEESTKVIRNVRGIKNFYVNFISAKEDLYGGIADNICGLIKQKAIASSRIVECPCKEYRNYTDPNKLISTNPQGALSMIMKELGNRYTQNVPLVERILKNARENKRLYNSLFKDFYTFIKGAIHQRSLKSQLFLYKDFVKAFMDEFKKSSEKPGDAADYVLVFCEYYSHIGATETNFNDSDIKTFLSPVYETRALRRWEAQIRLNLRMAQIRFNDYEFKNKAVRRLEEIYGKQEEVLKLLAEDGEDIKDNHIMTALGTLGQSYAYIGDYDNSEFYFNMSMNYAEKDNDKSTTCSYMFTISHRNRDLSKSRDLFENQTGMSPEDYFKKGDFSNNWFLLSYVKLRALDLYLNQSTALPGVDLDNLKEPEQEYPFNMIRKWEGIALFLEDKVNNKEKIAGFFTKAIESSKDSEFSIRTLALPIVQCFSLLDNQNKYHATYNSMLSTLVGESDNFKKYVEETDGLSSVKNGLDIWQRATLLPFIYA